MRKKGGNRLVSGTDPMVDALKLPNQAPRGSGKSLQKCVAHVVDLMEHSSSFVGHFCSIKYTVEPSWPLVLDWPSLEMLHRTLTTIVFTQYCSM
ncbi:hypothetical protein TNCV_1187501 [Trichonephila clavipes]|nr:hypothetical protein TNCV_1187501 [Trichonephila clavipes]